MHFCLMIWLQAFGGQGAECAVLIKMATVDSLEVQGEFGGL